MERRHSAHLLRWLRGLEPVANLADGRGRIFLDRVHAWCDRHGDTGALNRPGHILWAVMTLARRYEMRDIVRDYLGRAGILADGVLVDGALVDGVLVHGVPVDRVHGTDGAGGADGADGENEDKADP